jgi:Domain of unknown function (DUF4249)
MKTKALYLISLIVALASCTKVIDIDLNSADPRYVIEADLSTTMDSSMVKISKTLNITDTIANPPVSSALVTITDSNTTKVDTLVEVNKPGFYKKSGLMGIEGHTYKLKIVSESKTFTASSIINSSVALDSIGQPLSFDQSGGFGPGGGPKQGQQLNPSKTIILQPAYKPDPNKESYFQIRIFRNDSIQDNIYISGNKVIGQFSTLSPIRIKVKKFDKVKLDLQVIDKPVFDYFFGVTQNLGQFSASPANPKSNISNGALGYFKAHTSSIKEIVVK